MAPSPKNFSVPAEKRLLFAKSRILPPTAVALYSTNHVNGIGGSSQSRIKARLGDARQKATLPIVRGVASVLL